MPWEKRALIAVRAMRTARWGLFESVTAALLLEFPGLVCNVLETNMAFV
jgi:hypothetical protein